MRVCFKGVKRNKYKQQKKPKLKNKQLKTKVSLNRELPYKAEI